MTPGILLDTLILHIHNLVVDHPDRVFLLGLFALFLAIYRAFTNHYNFKRAWINSVSATLTVFGWYILNILWNLPSIDNQSAWGIIALTVLLIFFLILAYYIAAIFGRYFRNPLLVFKQDLISLLKVLKIKVEDTIETENESKPVERMEKQTIEAIKEVVTENAEQAKIYMGLL